MLEFKIVKHPDQIYQQLKSFDPHQTTWMVSDLKSKQEVQKFCIEKNGFFTDEAILRASDFWRVWFRRFYPTIKIVSDDFISILVKQYVIENKDKYFFTEQDEQALYFYINDLAPLLLHTESFESLKDWCEKQEVSISWQEKVYQARLCLIDIVNEKKCVSSKWILSLIQNKNLNQLNWPKKIICDLGSQMSSLEMGILKNLSQINDIEILVPDPEWKEKFKFILRTYEDYIGYVKYSNLTHLSHSQFNYDKKSFLRFGTEVNEIKFIVAKVRQWIDEGVELHKIQIVSPKVDSYWPILKLHLDKEGILYNKDHLVKLNTIGVVQQWISYLLVKTHLIDWESLQIIYKFVKDLNIEEIKQFENYKSYFNDLVDMTDLKKHQSIEEEFYLKIDLNMNLNRNDFFMLMIKNWIIVDVKNEFINIFQKIIKDFFQNSIDLELTINEWIDLLMKRLTKIELKVQQGSSNGLIVLSINSAQVFNITHRIWFGLDDSGFKSNAKTALPLKDIEQLKKDLDLPIEYPEESHGEFNLRWYALTECKEQYFTCSHLSSKNEPLISSLFFLENFILSNDYFNHDKDIYLDFEQKKLSQQFDSYLKSKNCENQQVDFIFNKFVRDFKPNHLNINHLEVKRLSPSDLEIYSRCSFKFLMQKFSKVKNLDSLGLEVKPRQNGQVIHDLFKYCLDHIKIVKEESINIFLEELRIKYKLFLMQDLFWIPKKKRYLKLALDFINAENERFKNWGNFYDKVHFKTEEVVKVYFDLNKKLFVSEKIGDEIEIFGRLDRLDIDLKNNFAIVYDYKSNKNDKIHNSKDWLKYNEYQLMIYTLAIEELFKLDVTAALYYFYKNFKHHYGFVKLPEHDEVYFLNQSILKSSKAKSDISHKELLQVKNTFLDKICEILSNIKDHQYKVDPIDESECEKCDWIDVCRIRSQR